MRFARLRLLTLVTFALWGCGGANHSGPADCTNPRNAACGTSGTCQAGTFRCGPEGAIHECKTTGDGWDVAAMCTVGQACSGGQCGPAACQAGQTQCTNGLIQTCIASVGAFSTAAPCETGKVCLGTQCVPTACSANQRFCDGETTVRQCDDLGVNSQVIDNCTGTSKCSGGQCISLCQLAEIANSSIGCTFYGADLDNFSNDDKLELDFGVANDTSVAGTVTIEVRQGGNWTRVCSQRVMPHQAKMIGMTTNCGIDQPTPDLIDRHVEDSGLLPGGAFRIRSEVPVAVYQFNSDDAVRAYSSGGAVLLPKHVLARKYLASVMPQPNPTDVTKPDDVAHGDIVIIATADGTNVTIVPKTTILAGPGVAATPAGQMVSYMLNEGDLLQLASTNVGDDLTGTSIEADKPIAVFGSNECATIMPRDPSNTQKYCDHTEEQLLPIQAWGKDFVAARVRPRSSAAGSDDPTVWRILASADGTEVTLDAAVGVMMTPMGPGPFSLNRGNHLDVVITNPALETPADFQVHATKPVHILEYTSGETVAVTVVPTEQLLSSYSFLVPDTFEAELTVMRPVGAIVQLDGMEISDSLFTPGGAGYEVARVPLQKGDTGAEPHLVETLPTPEGKRPQVGIDVRGMDNDCSYGYNGGLSVANINPVE